MADELPYVFDLLWDIKTKHQLLDKLVNNLEEAASLFACMDSQIELTPVDRAELGVYMGALNDAFNSFNTGE